MCFFFFVDSTRELITFPSICNDLLMLQPSRKRSPYTFVCFTLSLPARSIIWSLAFFDRIMSSYKYSLSIMTVKIAWERELSLFIIVVAILLVFSPSSNRLTADLYEATFFYTNPSTNTPLLASSRIWWILLSFES